jgi:hypothetical protein
MRLFSLLAALLLASIVSAWKVVLYQKEGYKGMTRTWKGTGKHRLEKCYGVGRLHNSVSSAKWDPDFKAAEGAYCCLKLYQKKGCKKHIDDVHYNNCHEMGGWYDMQYFGTDPNYEDKVNSFKVECIEPGL